ncbi:MAG: NUDIX hydrolase [Candidatus Aenigmatarchaeota archaeon]
MRARFPTVDIIIEKGSKIVLIKRKKEPFKDKWVLPGGHVEENETVEEAAIREAKEETSLDVKLKGILGVYSDPKRDPRYLTISTVFIVKPLSKKIKAGSDAAKVEWIDVRKIDWNNLGFDHLKILKDYLKYKYRKGTYWSKKWDHEPKKKT